MPAGSFLSGALRPSQAPALILGVFALLHLVLALLVDRADPELFVRADRAGERLQAVTELLAASSWAEIERFLATHGILGDYAAHALLYLAGGRAGVVIVQVALALLSGLCVYRIGSLLGLPARACAVAMTIYLALPHTLVFPHQLASEALHIPLLVASTWLLAEALVRPRLALVVASALCLALATLVRPIMLLWPFVAAVALALTVRPRTGIAYAAMAMLPIAAWMTFVGVHTGEFGLGKSGHSMERNLYERVERIAATMPADPRAQARASYLSSPHRELGPSAYLRFFVEYPGASLQHLLRDAFAFFGKSGIERVTIDYLAMSSGAKQLQDPDRGWRRHLEEHGPIETARYLSQTLGSVFFISLIGAALIVGLTCFALIGTVGFLAHWREAREPRILTGLLLAALVVYIFWFSQVINAMQSRHRAPAEFALVLLAAVGWCAWRERHTKERHRAPDNNKGTELAETEA